MEPSEPFSAGAASLREHAPGVEETHISYVFLVGDRVYKLKKPIQLPFLDWRERETRRLVCHREVELNRRLSPDVYLGVADVLGADGRPCDHLVVMRRMPGDRRLSRLVRDGADLRTSIEQLVELLATFHARADRTAATAAAASRDAVRRNWDDNLTTLREASPTILDGPEVELVAALAHRYLDGRGPLFAARAEAGMAVDGHGDLIADDIYLLDDGPRVLDCLEFSDALRSVDVLDDIAFLAMDLERLGARDLAVHLLDTYVERSGVHHPGSLAHHYIAYRAGVRSKVACIRAGQGDEAAADSARGLLALAHRHLEAADLRLVLVGGLPGTGKTTLAATVARRMGWQLRRSDVVRKELAGVPPTAAMDADYEQGIYEPGHTAATYERLLADARHQLERGEHVVLDASWTDPRWREAAAQVAAATSSRLVELRCVAPEEVAARRLVVRSGDASDATPAIARSMADATTSWPSATDIDTTGRPDDAAAAALGALGVVDDAR